MFFKIIIHSLFTFKKTLNGPQEVAQSAGTMPNKAEVTSSNSPPSSCVDMSKKKEKKEKVKRTYKKEKEKVKRTLLNKYTNLNVYEPMDRIGLQEHGLPKMGQ
jgi:hypothetical protein